MPRKLKIPELGWIGSHVLGRMRAEADRIAPSETGGVLLGYWAAISEEPVITHVIGPGPAAIHKPDFFLPDQRYHLTEIARLYEALGPQLCYLGDWHTHPGGAAYLSPTDQSTIFQIAREKAARAAHPIMVVLSPGPVWNFDGWVAHVDRRCFRRPRLALRPIRFRLFDISSSEIDAIYSPEREPEQR
jgi:integrative and conjugative element protein (TIGR02256 family)